MKKKHQLSRRDFFRSSAVATTALIGSASLASCKNDEKGSPEQRSAYPIYRGKADLSGDHVAGLLFSQIGYEPGYPVRIIIRLPAKEDLSTTAVCRLTPLSGHSSIESTIQYWGETWGSHWWEVRFMDMPISGEWLIEVQDGNEILFRDEMLRIEKGILWDHTIEWSSVDMLERRVHFTKVGAGWQDAGTLWVESCAQSAMVIGLEELLEKGAGRFDDAFKERIYKQVIVGCDYLVMTQEKARELGFPEGSMSHDLHGHERDILPNDATKAVVALWKAARLLPDSFLAKKEEYSRAADKAFDWLRNAARPMGDYGLSRFQRGLEEEVAIPNDEWQTRDLLMLCQGALEKYVNGDHGAKKICVDLAEEVYGRQLKKENPEAGFYGHFREYASLPHTEKAWCHGIVNNNFGADLGGIYPNYLMPVIEMVQLWPDHPDAGQWRSMLEDFTYGYLIPACERNPFKIVPLGIYGEEGPVWFCGTFHGTNAIYGYTAALALELTHLFDDPHLKEIAYGNLQWLAGLNGGITRQNLEKGCVIYSADVPEGLAMPASMICHIGDRWAGTWFQTRGVICNGFSTGAQFRYDVAPVQANDGPFSLTDEDWIPHSAAWLTGLVRL